MIVPKIERLALFGLPIVSLIDASYPSARSAYMIQHGFGDFEPDTQPLKTRRECSAKVMKPPRRNRAAAIFGDQPVDFLLSLMIGGETSTS
jgi:hypothetical protein